MEHPLIEVDKSLNEEKILNIIGDLNKKLTFAMRTNNADLVGQLRMALESYNFRLQQLYKEKENSADIEQYAKNIDIS